MQIYTIFLIISKEKTVNLQKFFLGMKTKLKFTIDINETSLNSEQVSVLGIVSHYNDFTFVARVNRFSKYKFYKSENFPLWKKTKKENDMFTAYHYNYKDKHCDLVIINTKNENNDTFISNWKNFNYLLIVVGRDNKTVIEEVHNSIKDNITYGEILSLQETTVKKTVNQVMQMDIFSCSQCVQTVKTTKQGISAEILDNFFIGLEDYLTEVSKDKKKTRINPLFKSFISLIFLLVFSFNLLGQDRLLSMKMIYTVPIMKAEIKSSTEKDSIEYSYIVDKRFWWQTFDKVMEKNQISYDSVVKRLSTTLKDRFQKEFTIEETKNIIDNNIRKIEFEEKWNYDTKTMLIKSEVVGFQPIITIDSIIFNEEEELEIKEIFTYPLGWFKPNTQTKKSDKVIVASNIEFTMPIYNPIPYQYFFSHLEAEYSLPFLDMLFSKAESNKIKTFEMPSSSSALNTIEVIKRLEHQEREVLVFEDSLGNVSEQDTVMKIRYRSEEIDYFRFGQQWIFDLESLTFYKQINYFAPVIKLTSSKGEFRGYYPLFYIRKD